MESEHFMNRGEELKDYVMEVRKRTHSTANQKASIIFFLSSHIFEKSEKILSVGDGDGYIRKLLQQFSGKTIIGSDYEERERYYAENFVQCSVTDLKFEDESFDLVLANNIYEHITSEEQIKMINEISRVLRPNGFLYFATSMKYAPLEPHTGLPFLGCIPKPMANFLVNKIRGREFFDINSPSYGMLMKNLNRYFTVDNVTLKLIYGKNAPKMSHQKTLRKLPVLINKALLRISPNIKLICQKK